MHENQVLGKLANRSGSHDARPTLGCSGGLDSATLAVGDRIEWWEDEKMPLSQFMSMKA